MPSFKFSKYQNLRELPEDGWIFSLNASRLDSCGALYTGRFLVPQFLADHPQQRVKTEGTF